MSAKLFENHQLTLFAVNRSQLERETIEVETKKIKLEEARNSLPAELRSIFDEFIADYKYAATLRYGKPYISYIVLADMIRAGWRSTAEPIK